MQLTNFKLYTRWILLDDENRVLFIKKNSTRRIAPWRVMCPWWTVELWEKIEDALIREVYEEVGVKVAIKNLVWVKNIFLWDTQWLWVYYYVEWDYAGSYNKEPTKHDFIKFYSIEELEEMNLDELEQVERSMAKEALRIKNNLTINK